MVKNEIAIYFGSQTGTAEGFALDLQKEAQQHGLVATVIDLAEVTELSFLNYRYIIMCMATHYEGNPTDNAELFWQWFSKEDEIPLDWLQGYKFTVFALGDTSYENFAKIGKETDRLLEKYGATRAYKLGVGSDEDGTIAKYFKEWKKDIWEQLAKEFVMIKGEGHQATMELNAAHFSTTISSFHQEKPVLEQRKDMAALNFKAQNYLNHEPLRIGSRS